MVVARDPRRVGDLEGETRRHRRHAGAGSHAAVDVGALADLGADEPVPARGLEHPVALRGPLEGGDHVGIEPRVLGEPTQGLPGREGWVLGRARGERVEAVRHRDDPGAEGDLRPEHPAGVPGAVHPLVMGGDGRERRQGERDPVEHAHSGHGVLAHAARVAVTGTEQPDVVEQSRRSQLHEGLGADPEGLADPVAEDRHTLRVRSRSGMTDIESGDEGVGGPLVGLELGPELAEDPPGDEERHDGEDGTEPVDLGGSPEDDEEERHHAVAHIRCAGRGEEAADVHPERHAGRDGHHSGQDDGVRHGLGDVGDHERQSDAEDDFGRSDHRHRVRSAGRRIRESADETDDAEHAGVEPPSDRTHAHGPGEAGDDPDETPTERSDHDCGGEGDDPEEREAHPVPGEGDDRVRKRPREKAEKEQGREGHGVLGRQGRVEMRERPDERDDSPHERYIAPRLRRRGTAHMRFSPRSGTAVALT